MSRGNASRRQFMAGVAVMGGSSLISDHAWVHRLDAQEQSHKKKERLGVGAIGMRYQGSVIAHKAQRYADIVAVCDVDQHVRAQAKASFGSVPADFEDYRDLLAQKNVDIVTIGTPDHWHVKMAVDALRAGKDVYVEKPLTLTVDEGKLLRKVARETGGIVQVGSWQRSDSRFRLAVEMVRQGRLGKLHRVDVVLGKNKVGGPFLRRDVPGHVNWDVWQGQTADTPYLEERCHYTFRWWHEYSGGQMTDWGAHHLDIAQWGIDSLPVAVKGEAKYPHATDSYNVAIDFQAQYKYANGVIMNVSDTGRNGIIFHGDKGRIFVNRGTIAGKPVEELASNPLPRESFTVYDFDNLNRPERAGKLESIVNHMGNFFDCVRTRKLPISNVESQHRSVTTCHLGNLSMQLGRPLNWDPEKELFVGDPAANELLARKQRPGFEVV